MIYLLFFASLFGTVYFILRRRKNRFLNTLFAYEVVYLSSHFSIYSKSLIGGRTYGVVSNSAPLRRSSFIFESSSLDTAIAFVKRCEDLIKVV